jgi:hypothetical protein
LPAATKKAACSYARKGKPFPVHAHIRRRLKNVFDEIMTQAMPAKLVKLLEALAEREAGRCNPAKSRPLKSKPRKSKWSQGSPGTNRCMPGCWANQSTCLGVRYESPKRLDV